MNTKFPMKNPKAGQEMYNKAQRDGQLMGQRFAAHRGIEFMLQFFKDAELNTDMYDLYNFRRDPTGDQLSLEQFSLLLTDDLKIPFGKVVALAYAMGYIDRAAGLRPKDIKMPEGFKESTEAPELEEQLELPGVLE